jgi:hypothetical protein
MTQLIKMQINCTHIKPLGELVFYQVTANETAGPSD